MILGYAFITLALISTVVAAALFLRAQRPAPIAIANGARIAATLSAFFVVCAAVYLIHLIDSHQFQVAYVAEFSSKGMQARYLLAAFWGGQEGSILLWTFWTAILGALLAFRAGGKEARVWPIFAVIQTFLLVLVLMKSPFALGRGPAPADGQGLNPLLENVWMVIHPPILFLGFASMAIPWVWAVYGLLYKDFDGWLARAGSWILFAFAAQGFGIALGGYWAYETLGWGGFWGWDPVENSSLVPWLFLIALLHGMPIQKTNGGFKVSNLLFAILPFSLMCYGTFLTRSGILADFSVHSFSSLGSDGFAMLLGGVIFSAGAPLALLAARLRAIPKPVAYGAVVSREFGLALAFIVLGVLGLIAAAGMSAPLISRLWLAKGAAAQPDYYNHATFPLVVVLMLLLGVTPFLAWRHSEPESFGAKLMPAYLVSLAFTVIVFALGCRNPWMLLLFAVSCFATAANAHALVTRLRQSRTRWSAGAALAHIGGAMLLIGIACLVAFSQDDKQLTLIKNMPTSALGYTLTYLGMTSQPYDRDNALRIRVEKNGKSWEATPHLYMAPWNGQDQQFANPPDIHNFLWGDLYMAHDRGPLSIAMQSPNNGVTLHKGDSFTYGDYQFNYSGLAWGDEVQNAMLSGPAALNNLPQMKVAANLSVAYHGATYQIKPVFVYDQQSDTKYAIPAALPGPKNAIVAINDVNLPNDVTITTWNLPDPMEMVQIDLSTKPMIWLVWLGTVLYTIGGLIAFRKRVIEYGAEPAPAEPEPASDPASPLAGTSRSGRRKPVHGLGSASVSRK